MRIQLLAISVGGIVGLSLLGGLILAGVVIFLCVFPVKLYFRCMSAGINISAKRLLAMKWKKFDANQVITPYLTAKKAGINLSFDDLETHVLSGGNIDKVVRALISARGANINLSLQSAMAIDMSGKDVVHAVQDCIVPRVFTVPTVTAIAKDGMEVVAGASVTLKGNMRNLIGGVDADTILARVAEGLSSAIGSAVNHKAIIENPDVVSTFLEQKGYDMGSSYDIVSIDITKLSVGKDWALQRKIEQAEADKKIAIARNEELKAQAILKEQEAKIKIQEAKMRVVESESEVPKALVKAIEEGRLSTMDYLDMQNVQADTKMREALANNVAGTNPKQQAPARKKNPFDF